MGRSTGEANVGIFVGEIPAAFKVGSGDSAVKSKSKQKKPLLQFHPCLANEFQSDLFVSREAGCRQRQKIRAALHAWLKFDDPLQIHTFDFFWVLGKVSDHNQLAINILLEPAKRASGWLCDLS
jgi:hypothetical protein